MICLSLPFLRLLSFVFHHVHFERVRERTLFSHPLIGKKTGEKEKRRRKED